MNSRVSRAMKLYSFASSLRIANWCYYASLFIFLFSWIYIVIRQSKFHLFLEAGWPNWIWGGPMPVAAASVSAFFFTVTVGLFSIICPIIQETFHSVLEDFDSMLASDEYKTLTEQERRKVEECIDRAEPYAYVNRASYFMQLTLGALSTILFSILFAKSAITG